MPPPWNYITSADEQAANQFFQHHLTRHIGVPSGPLFHYTSGDKLISILESGTLWSTQIACLNDSKEVTYAIEEFHKRVKARRAASTDPLLAPLYERLERLTCSPEMPPV